MNKRMMQWMLGSSLLLAAGAVLACPGSDGPCPAVEGRFRELDSNKDGFISKAEFDRQHGRRFNEMDSNKDGKISLEEMQAAHEARERRYLGRAEGFKTRFDEADADKDGRLSKEEATKMPVLSEHFDEFDADKDGKLTHDEIRNGMWEAHHPGGKGMMRPAP